MDQKFTDNNDLDNCYKPYLLDDGKHYLTSRERTSNYWNGFYAANEKRFGVPTEPAKVEEVVAPVAPTCKKKFKKNMGAIVVNFVAVVLFIALAAVSYFALLKDYTYFFANVGSQEIFDAILNADIADKAIGDIIMIYAVPGTAVLAAVLAIVDLIVSIAAMASKKKVNAMGALSVIALAAWLACGVLTFFYNGVAQDSASIIAYINPLEASTGVLYGYYIGAALLLIATICGFCCYGKKKK